ncbi:cation transporter [Flavobacterium sp.]|uniref:heavy-metal-associated domain-containing protein n=1 Tax=Flavobacterium sp. TaxID=239 RepID=UPI00286DA60A|nr:cation transporter [Flavobacterium sp.]
MKKSIITLSIFLIVSSVCYAQIKNAKTATVKIYGSCFMCKAKIETNGNRKNISQVDWNLQTLMATITYDAKKTTLSKILKRIASAGFDNEQFLAPDAVYEKLDKCCHYERILKHQYECKMCKKTAMKSGKCPICDMDMTKKKK